MAPLYGMFRYGNAAFLIINTDDVLDVTLANACDYNGYVGKAQLAALQAEALATLKNDATVTHIFCFMHRPIKDKGGSQIGAAKGDTSPYATQVEAFGRRSIAAATRRSPSSSPRTIICSTSIRSRRTRTVPSPAAFRTAASRFSSSPAALVRR